MKLELRGRVPPAEGPTAAVLEVARHYARRSQTREGLLTAFPTAGVRSHRARDARDASGESPPFKRKTAGVVKVRIRVSLRSQLFAGVRKFEESDGLGYTAWNNTL